MIYGVKSYRLSGHIVARCKSEQLPRRLPFQEHREGPNNPGPSTMTGIVLYAKLCDALNAWQT
jgi:hypothetical protein